MKRNETELITDMLAAYAKTTDSSSAFFPNAFGIGFLAGYEVGYEENRWIDARKEYPSKPQILIYSTHEQVLVCYRNSEGDYNVQGTCFRPLFSHWQPLPAPPKVGK